MAHFLQGPCSQEVQQAINAGILVHFWFVLCGKQVEIKKLAQLRLDQPVLGRPLVGCAGAGASVTSQRQKGVD